MAEMQTSKYLRQLFERKTHHPEIKFPIPQLESDATFGNMGFNTYYEHITGPFTHADKPHVHDFPQFLIYLGDRENMMERTWKSIISPRPHPCTYRRDYGMDRLFTTK